MNLGGTVAIQLETPKLNIGYQDAVDQDAAPDPAAEGEHDHQALDLPGSSEPCFAESGGVGVVDHRHLTPGHIGQHRPCIDPDPGRIDVVCGVHDTVDNNRREPDANGSFVPEVVHKTGYGRAHCLGSCRFGSVDPHPFTNKRAGLEVDNGDLDTGSSDVDA